MDSNITSLLKNLQCFCVIFCVTLSFIAYVLKLFIVLPHFTCLIPFPPILPDLGNSSSPNFSKPRTSFSIVPLLTICSGKNNWEILHHGQWIHKSFFSINKCLGNLHLSVVEALKHVNNWFTFIISLVKSPSCRKQSVLSSDLLEGTGQLTESLGGPWNQIFLLYSFETCRQEKCSSIPCGFHGMIQLHSLCCPHVIFEAGHQSLELLSELPQKNQTLSPLCLKGHCFRSFTSSFQILHLYVYTAMPRPCLEL